jgi:hypothetical protein
MVGITAVSWGIWTLQNKVTFENYVIRNPAEVVFTVCSFLLFYQGYKKKAIRRSWVRIHGK